jgi:hypothetical protein
VSSSTLFCLSFSFIEQSLRLRVVFWIGVRVLKRVFLEVGGLVAVVVALRVGVVSLLVLVVVGVLGFAMMALLIDVFGSRSFLSLLIVGESI